MASINFQKATGTRRGIYGSFGLRFRRMPAGERSFEVHLAALGRCRTDSHDQHRRASAGATRRVGPNSSTWSWHSASAQGVKWRVSITVDRAIEPEAIVLGNLLLNGPVIEQTVGLCFDDFLLEAHRKVFRRMTEVHQGGQPIDIVTLSDALERYGELRS